MKDIGFETEIAQTLNASVCPCPTPFRFLEEGTGVEETDVMLWEVLFTSGVLLVMFVALISDRVGADSVMLVALTAFIVAQIITIEEGLKGFSNEGLLTVLVLFVVAEGISKTGALDWYMGKLLGRPDNSTSAQIRLMAPIALVSAFLNNTPVVAVMIPIVQRWGKNIHISAQQLLIPLSFASILGGTCTLIGTSTNLVVVGLLEDRYPNDSSLRIGLFDLGLYGVPIAFTGICYVLLASPFLLPGGSRRKSGDRGSVPLDNQEDILLGARLTPWSPAAGRSVKRSGLRDTGGIYLVSVHRAATGNIHRAVGQEFVVNVGDILYFTGMIEGFGVFCEEHGLEVLTNEIEEESRHPNGVTEISNKTPPTVQEDTQHEPQETEEAVTILNPKLELSIVAEVDEENDELPIEVGATKESLMQADDDERSRVVTRMTDLIRNVARDEPMGDENIHLRSRRKAKLPTEAHKVIVTSEHGLVVVGVDAHDRPGLLLDISKGLSRLDLDVRHSEARVVGKRSISVWRCEMVDHAIADLEEIWSVLNALLENDSGSQALKQRGLVVIRAVVTKVSSLVGKTIAEANFRKQYRAAIVAVQKGGKNVPLFGVVFGSGDVLVLQVSEGSALLKRPPDDFYRHLGDGTHDGGTVSRSNSVASFVNKLTKNLSSASLEIGKTTEPVNVEQNQDIEAPPVKNIVNPSDEGFFIGMAESDDEADADSEAAGVLITDMVSTIDAIESNENVWKDLQVIFIGKDGEEGSGPTREFLLAMEVAPKSNLAKKTVKANGLDKLPGVFLISIDRPSSGLLENRTGRVHLPSRSDNLSPQLDDESAVESAVPTIDQVFTTITPDVPLEEGDVLWFAGSAQAVGDLRKIPGLVSSESDEVEKINEKVHDRRLVEAVVARRGPLVGKTVKEVRFRTRYGAAVIAVHRDGKRIHDHPGRIKLQAGDVLLLEAGPTFIRKNADHDKAFALLVEVADSAPPRLRLLIPALLIATAMLAVFTSGVTSLLVCALVASFLMVALGILSEQEARDAVNWEVYITIAAAFGIGIALVNSGVAGGIASFLVDVGEAVGIGEAGLLGAVYFATFLISNVVTNNAAAALLFPIAMDAAEQTGIDRILMSYCIMLGASASFMSPFGYTTNLLIYGPGGYKYKDFLAIGTPMQIVLWVLSTLFLATTTSKNWWVSWLVSFLATCFAVAMPTCQSCFRVCRSNGSTQLE